MEYQWYIICTSGSEKSIKRSILQYAIKNGYLHYIKSIIIPGVKVLEMKQGKQVSVDKKIISGYILMNINMIDEIKNFITTIPKVNRFPGSDKIKSVLEKEVQEILEQLKNKAHSTSLLKKYDIGEEIKIIDGPFETFLGKVQEVDNAKNKLKVSVEIFKRSTILDVDFSQVEKIKDRE